MLTLSFFSYKGGSGRSSMVYNTLPFLAETLKASREHPIVVADLDIDSAGLSILFTPDKFNKSASSVDSVPMISVDRILDEKNAMYSDTSKESGNKTFPELFNYNMYAKIGNKIGYSSDASVLFVPAIPSQIKNTFNVSANGPIHDFVKTCENYGAAAVIFDTPAGDQTIARGAVNNTRTLVVCLRITKQHREGTANYLKRKLNDIDGRRIIVVPNAVPDVNEKILINGIPYNFEAVRQSMIENYGKIIEDSDDNTFVDEMLSKDYYGIPEVKRFRFQEGILYDIKNNLRYGVEFTEDEEKAYNAYKHLAEVIAESKR